MYAMDESPYAPPTSTREINSPVLSVAPCSVVSEGAIFKQWLVFFLASTIFGFLAGAAAGGFVGFILGMAQASMQTVRLAAMVAGFIAGLPVSYLCFRMCVKNLLARIR